MTATLEPPLMTLATMAEVTVGRHHLLERADGQGRQVLLLQSLRQLQAKFAVRCDAGHIFFAVRSLENDPEPRIFPRDGH